MKIILNILSIPFRLLATVIWIPIFLIVLLFSWLFCFIGLFVFIFNYKNIRGNGTGIFHAIFFHGLFDTINLYKTIKLIKRIWSFGSEHD